MSYRVRDVMATLEYDELLRMKKDLESGGVHLKKLVDEKVKEHERQHEVYCATCSNKLDEYSTNNYTLLFGPSDFQKKASFCALDCLEYFLEFVKKTKNGVREVKNDVEK